MSVSTQDRFRGCLLGGAGGDALGASIEFDSLSQIRSKFGERGLSGYAEAFGRRGAISDDTQMSLWTAEGLLRARSGDNEKRIRDAYARWLHTQGSRAKEPSALDGWLIEQDFLHSRRAPGHTCLSALERGEAIRGSKGCGGVMRVAPVGLAIDDPFETATDAAAITHGHPTGSLSSGAFAEVIARLRVGDSLKGAVNRAMDVLRQHEHHEETTRAIQAAVRTAESAPATPETVETLGAGWIAEEALAIALFCALVATDFRTGVLLAVNHSGDSDSTGAIAGNLLGTMLGVDAIPSDWLAELEGKDVISQVADDLYAGFVEQADVDRERYPGD